MKRLFALALGMIAFLSLKAQINPTSDPIFREDEIAEVYLIMSIEDKSFLLADENIWSDIYLPATFRFKNNAMDTTLLDQVGIRLRGNTSRNHPKRSFKLKFKDR